MNWKFGRAAVWFTFTAFIAAVSAASAQQPARSASGEDDKAKVLLQSKCTVCHGLESLPNQNLDKAGWKTKVDSMRSQGADLKDDEAMMIVDYLSRTYPVDNEAEMKQLVESACTSCHGMDVYVLLQKSKDEWAEITREMISYGASIKEPQIESVAEYLARHYPLKK